MSGVCESYMRECDGHPIHEQLQEVACSMACARIGVLISYVGIRMHTYPLRWGHDTRTCQYRLRRTRRLPPVGGWQTCPKPTALQGPLVHCLADIPFRSRVYILPLDPSSLFFRAPNFAEEFVYT